MTSASHRAHQLTSVCVSVLLQHGARYLESTLVQKKLYSATLAGNLIRLFRQHIRWLDNSRKQASHAGKAVHQNGKEEFAASESVEVPAEDGSAGPQVAQTPIAPAAEQWDLAQVFSAPTLREFDKRFTRIAFGYATVDDYYRDASSARFVKFIHTPVLFLSALDDPIVAPTAIPYDECSVNPFVTLVTTPAGGHSMDHFEGAWNTRSWSVQAIAAFFADVLSSGHGLVGNQARATPMASPPPPAPQKSQVQAEEQQDAADTFASLESEALSQQQQQQHQNGWASAVPFTPSAPVWGGFQQQQQQHQQQQHQQRQHAEEEDVHASLQAALELQQRLAELERVLEEGHAEDEGIELE
jgi:hypothetical protein